MKIIHTESSWGWGGQEIRILTESSEFIRHGHDVTVVADPRSTIAQRAADFKVPVVHTVLRAKRLPDLLGLHATLRSLKPEVVVCHSSTDHWLSAVARLALTERPAIVRARHVSAKINDLPTTRWLYKKGCEGVLTTSTSIKAAMIRQGLGLETDIVCIPTGISNPNIKSNSIETRSKLNVPKDSFLVSIVATLRSWKGHSDLLRALALIEQPHNFRVLIVGDGPQRRNLENLSHELGVGSQTIFVGQRNDVFDLLNASDVFTLPSFANEGIPQAILQAMAVGLPIVTCPVGGIPEALEGYPNKYLVPPKSPDGLAKALVALRDEFQLESRDHRPRTPLMRYTKEGMYANCLDLYARSIRRLTEPHTNADQSHC